jgi:hypothetical protein
VACQKCIDEGKQKIIHFTRCGRWDTRIYCAHTYTRGKLNGNETHHVLSGQDKKQNKTIKHAYSEAEDQFIIRNYSDHRNRLLCRGEGRMQKMLDEYNRVFGRRPTANQMVGRYNRLLQMAKERAEQIRPTPSLPVLRFMSTNNA